MRCGLTALLALASVAPAAAADATYTDPRQPSFTLLVPDGWTATRIDSGVVMSHGKSFFNLFVAKGATSPGAMLVQIRPQLEKQWQQFHETESGKTQFGGQSAAFEVYGGIPPSGVPSTERIVAMTDGTFRYVAFESAAEAEAGAVIPELARIDRSFTLSSPR